MSIEVTRIAVDGLSCHDCDCGVCLTAAVAAIKAINGVVYVGIDRRRLTILVRYEESATDPATVRSAVMSSGLSIAASDT
jgi:copper chaperone CopZ